MCCPENIVCFLAAAYIQVHFWRKQTIWTAVSTGPYCLQHRLMRGAYNKSCDKLGNGLIMPWFIQKKIMLLCFLHFHLDHHFQTLKVIKTFSKIDPWMKIAHTLHYLLVSNIYFSFFKFTRTRKLEYSALFALAFLSDNEHFNAYLTDIFCPENRFCLLYLLHIFKCTPY